MSHEKDEFLNKIINIGHSWLKNIDVSSWDSSLQLERFRTFKVVPVKLLRFHGADQVAPNWLHTFDQWYDDMIHTKTIMDDGESFRAAEGMKSGWPSTAFDNTLIHCEDGCEASFANRN